ncbi:MAG: hypothetical protein AAGK33_08235 [Pseudomonadota bacterium]
MGPNLKVITGDLNVGSYGIRFFGWGVTFSFDNVIVWNNGSNYSTDVTASIIFSASADMSNAQTIDGQFASVESTVYGLAPGGVTYDVSPSEGNPYSDGEVLYVAVKVDSANVLTELDETDNISRPWRVDVGPLESADVYRPVLTWAYGQTYGWYYGWGYNWNLNWFQGWAYGWNVGWYLSSTGWTVGWNVGWHAGWQYGWTQSWFVGWHVGWHDGFFQYWGWAFAYSTDGNLSD